MKTSECKIRVRYAETSRLGFVHHSHYFDWFDVAQENFLEDVGMKYSELEGMGLRVLPISNMCKYFTPAYHGDTLTIRITLTSIKGVRLGFSYEIIRDGDGELIASGESEHIVVNERMRPVIISQTLPKIAAASGLSLTE